MSRKRRWKSLTHKVEYLRLEVEDRDETLKSLETDFLKQLSEVIDGSIIPDPEVQDKPQVHVVDQTNPPPATPEQAELETKTESLPDDIKKLWRTIALLTHPDRTKNDPRKTQLYLEANKAAIEGAVDEIVRIAMELNIDVPEASEAAVVKLEMISKELQEKLVGMESSVIWAWGQAKSEDKKKILDLFIQMKGFKKKNPEVV